MRHDLACETIHEMRNIETWHGEKWHNKHVRHDTWEMTLHVTHNMTFQIWHVRHDMWNMKWHMINERPDIWYDLWDMWHMTCQICHMIIWSYFQIVSHSRLPFFALETGISSSGTPIILNVMVLWSTEILILTAKSPQVSYYHPPDVVSCW